jgi:hypothetical protein
MYIQTGPNRWTDATYAAQLGRKRYVAPATPAKATSPAVSKAVPPAPVLRPATLAPRISQPAKTVPPRSVPLPSAPTFSKQARFMGRHELRAAGTEAKLWLTAAKAASRTRLLTSDERHAVECTEARLNELRQAAGLDGANW